MSSPDTSHSSQSRETVDLTNCDREPIHILGRVQSFGALISVSSDWIINHASKNVEAFLGEDPFDLIGRPFLDRFSGSAMHDIRAKLQLVGSDDAVERLFGMEIKQGYGLFDVAVHISGRSVIIELERHPDSRRTDYNAYVRPMIDRVGKAETIQTLCDVAARQVRALTGFDRVMVYRFEPDDSGTVISESLKPGMEPFKGLRYPASDIPKQARALYKRSLLRIISDVNDDGHEIVPATNPDGEPLDLSLSTTRAVSPIHLEYLKNMGVGASMSVSIIKRGKLWGLFSCHHDTPKTLSYDIRTATELFGQLFSFVLDQKESDKEREETARGRILHDQLMSQMAENSSIADNFETIVSAVEGVIPFDGVIGWIDEKFISHGDTPTEDEFKGLSRFLNTTAASRIYAQSKLSDVYPKAGDFIDRAAGLLVLPVSRSPRDYIVLFRREIAQSVNWAGNPEKPAEHGPNGVRLTPRKSFEAWRQIVRGESAPWTQIEINAAEALRMTLLEVVLRMTDAANKERARSHEKQEFLIAELNHRVRNILNLIRSLITQTSSEGQSVSDFTETIGGRIHALGRAHDQITRENWAPASVHELIRTESEAYLGSKFDKVTITGPDPLVEPAAFTTLSLVVHELVTNSAKYGALSTDVGKVKITIQKELGGALSLGWREIEGPPITSAPTRRGFGSTIIERSVPYELNGTATVEYAETGLEARFEIPALHINAFVAVGSQSAAVDPVKPETDNVISGEVLLVEDNMIIALDSEDALSELGAAKVHVAANVAAALDILERETISLALLDVNLGGETSEPIAAALQAHSITFLFATGYGDTAAIGQQFPNAGIIQKPYNKNTIAAALTK